MSLLCLAACKSHNTNVDANIVIELQIDEYQGIDVSHYQSERKEDGKWVEVGKIDWAKVAEDKAIQFVYIKATQGSTITDKYFSHNLTEARKNGLKVGAYHFYSTQSSVEDQFRFFTSTCPKENVDLIPMIDVEPGSNPSAEKRSKVQKEVRELAKMVEDYYGVKPMLYATQRSYNEYLAPEFNKDFLLYIGRYQSGSKPPVINGPDHYDIWQFSETGAIQGIPRPVDLCRFHPDTKLEDICLPMYNQGLISDETLRRLFLDKVAASDNQEAEELVFVRKNVNTLVSIMQLDGEYRTEKLMAFVRETPLSNSGKCGVIYFCGSILESMSKVYFDAIENTLNAKQRKVFTAERKAYQDWHKFQDRIRDEVILDVWETRIGGTAGATLEARHYYEMEALNYEYLKGLCKALQLIQ